MRVLKLAGVIAAVVACGMIFATQHEDWEELGMNLDGYQLLISGDVQVTVTNLDTTPKSGMAEVVLVLKSGQECQSTGSLSLGGNETRSTVVGFPAECATGTIEHVHPLGF